MNAGWGFQNAVHAQHTDQKGLISVRRQHTSAFHSVIHVTDIIAVGL
jgi:hypothetical protein